MKDKEILKAIKDELTRIVETKPQWKPIWGREVLTAPDLLQRLDKDKYLRQFLVEGWKKLGEITAAD